MRGLSFDGPELARHSPLATSIRKLRTSESEPILDVYGNEVDSSERYYLVSALWGVKTGGGISVDKAKYGRCPKDVIQLSPKNKRNKNVGLFPYDNSTIVRESTNIKLKFSRVSSLQQRNKDKYVAIKSQQ
ncbi:hypothetical protein WN943_015213 [Citrus x changshan-huyou]